MLSDRTDPYRGFNFRIELGGVVVASFTEATGLTTERDTVAYTVRKPIRLRGSTSILLKRGLTTSQELLAWACNNASGVVDRRSGAIVQIDEKQNEVRRWSFTSGWVKKIESAELNATANEVAIESVELTHEGLVLET